MKNDIKKYSLESDTFYKSITRVTFTPIEEFTSYDILHKRGDVEYKCNLFTLFEKKVKKVYTDNIIKTRTWGYGCYDEISMEGFVRKNKTLFIKDDKIYHKAEVLIETNIKDGDRLIRFENNDEAINYMNLLKQNCKKFDNTLI